MAAAEKEGALNVIALPHDWSNYGDVISGFKKKYPKIKINEQNPNASSKEEVDAGKTNKGTDAAPDVYDLGLAVASTSTDNFASYKVQAWDKIPDSVKDKDGKYYADYTGIMSIGWNADKYGDIKSINDLTDPKFAGTVALNGKPAEAGAAFNGYLMINQLAGGDIKNLQPGLDFFKKLKDCGNLTTVDVTDGTIRSSPTPRASCSPRRSSSSWAPSNPPTAASPWRTSTNFSKRTPSPHSAHRYSYRSHPRSSAPSWARSPATPSSSAPSRTACCAA